MKLLSPRIHGYGDYLIVLLLAFAPSLFGFVGAPSVLCYVLAAMQLGMSLLTAYPLGLKHLIPFPIHGGVEVAVTILLFVAPWLFGFSQDLAARNFFLIAGGGLAVVYLVTNYRGVADDRTRRPAHGVS